MALKPEDKVLVKNLCAWPVYFARQEGRGEVKVVENGNIRLTVEEIESQVNVGNKMFVGEDGRGSNARLYIDSKELRVHLEFERDKAVPTDDEDAPPTEQKVLTEDAVKKLLALKTQATFEKRVKEDVVTTAEKAKLVEVAAKTKLNDHKKLQFIEEYAELKVNI